VFVLIDPWERTRWCYGHRGPGLADLVGKVCSSPACCFSCPRALLSRWCPNIPLLEALTPLLLETMREQRVSPHRLPLFAALQLEGEPSDAMPPDLEPSANLRGRRHRPAMRGGDSVSRWLGAHQPCPRLRCSCCLCGGPWLRLKACRWQATDRITFVKLSHSNATINAAPSFSITHLSLPNHCSFVDSPRSTWILPAINCPA